MRYHGACDKCGGDTGQDRIDMLVRELADLHAEIKRLEEAVRDLLRLPIKVPLGPIEIGARMNARHKVEELLPQQEKEEVR